MTRDMTLMCFWTLDAWCRKLATHVISSLVT